MSYTTQERNNAIINIANNKADLENTGLYKELESFNWIKITRLDGAINKVELTYAGKDLYRRFLEPK